MWRSNENFVCGKATEISTTATTVNSKVKLPTSLCVCDSDRQKMLGSNSYEFNNTMECRDRDDEDSIGGGGYNNINVLRNGRGKFSLKSFVLFAHEIIQLRQI